MKFICLYILVGFMISTWNGNLDSKYDLDYKIKSVLYWPAFAINLYNEVSKINQVRPEHLKDF